MGAIGARFGARVVPAASAGRTRAVDDAAAGTGGAHGVIDAGGLPAHAHARQNAGPPCPPAGVALRRWAHRRRRARRGRAPAPAPHAARPTLSARCAAPWPAGATAGNWPCPHALVLITVATTSGVLVVVATTRGEPRGRPIAAALADPGCCDLAGRRFWEPRPREHAG